MKPLRHWRPRERDAMYATAALALALIVATLKPDWDLRLSSQFWRADQGFVGGDRVWVQLLYVGVPWFGRAAGLLGLLVALLWWRQPGRWGVRWWRRCMVLALAMLVAVGGLVNGALKEHWGRARPVDVQPFGGDRHYTPAWRPASECNHNCSFVSGHAATGFALLALGMLGTLRTRRRWAWVGLAAGALVGLGRIEQGGHFMTDVVFAGLVVWMACVMLRLLWLTVVARRRRRVRRRGASALPMPWQRPGKTG